MSIQSIKASISLAAEREGLDPLLIESIVEVESGFDVNACRYEQHTNKYVLNADEFASKSKISRATELQLQKFSFGLMQIMGFKLREMGHQTSLLECLNQDVNLLYGCKFFRSLLQKYGDESQAIASYNAGSPRYLADGQFINSAYVNKINAIVKKKREGKHGNH